MSESNITIQLSKTQRDFLQSQERLVRLQAGLGSGKSYVLLLWSLLQAIEGYDTLYILPSFSMVGDIAIPTAKEIVSLMGLENHVKIRLSPPELEIPGKGKILFRSAEQRERLRGVNCHNLCFDEAGYITEEVYKVAIARARVKRKDGKSNFVRLVSTPSGASHWFSKLKSDETFTQSTMESPFLSNEYKKQLYDYYSQFGEEMVRQELYGEAQNLEEASVFIPQQIVDKAIETKTIIDESEVTVAGFDIAASEVGDSSVLTVRRGKEILHIQEYRIRDSIELAERASEDLLKWRVSEVVCDAPGVGMGVISALKRYLGSTSVIITEFFGWNPSNMKEIANKRAESYWRAKEWLKNGGKLDRVLHKDLIEQLSWTHWQMNSKQQILMEPKEILKKRTGKSPDFSDSFAMSCMVNDTKITKPMFNSAFSGYSGW